MAVYIWMWVYTFRVSLVVVPFTRPKLYFCARKKLANTKCTLMIYAALNIFGYTWVGLNNTTELKYTYYIDTKTSCFPKLKLEKKTRKTIRTYLYIVFTQRLPPKLEIVRA